MTKWMTAAGALIASLSIQPAFADGDAHWRGNGGGQRFHEASPIPARPYGGGGWSGGSGGRWNGGSVRSFNEYRGHVRDDWQRGRWAHVEHGGRFGWWWVAGPTWYPYASPVYPYPRAYGVWTEPVPVAQDAYYCASYQAYYPDVTQCPEDWVLVAP